MNSFSNCSVVENDENVVTSGEFTIPLNPINRYSKSYGSTYKNGHIFHLKIVNKKSIPSTIFGLTYLKRLEIRNSCFFPCNRPQVPSEIECLRSSLTELSIYDTKITQLPNEIGKLVHLQVLKLSNTGLMSLPDSIGDLSSLAFLYLPNNNLKSLPKTIKNLRSLQQLTLSNNRYLHSIEPLNGLPSLRILDTRNCRILVLPQNLPQLTDLYMSNNSLTKLAAIETLGTATNNKKSFYFDMNYIESVPPQIQEVKNLFWLTLNQNKLKDLPTDIFKVTTLSYLNIQRNDFDQRDLKTIVFNFHNSNPNVSILYK
jgi:Leucine-rich repeat (LRR) protein